MNSDSMRGEKTTGDIVVTGMGTVSPFGLGIEPFKEGMERGKSAIGRIDRFEIRDWCDARLGAAVPDFSLEELTGNSKESGKAAPHLRLGWAAAHLALADARLLGGGNLGERTGVFVGLSRFVLDRLEYTLTKIIKGPLQDILPIQIEGIHPHGLAVYLSYFYKIFGPTLTFSASCQSAVQALEAAMFFLATGRIDTAIVLSSDTLSPFQFHVEAKAGILSSRASPDSEPRPYDREADGAVAAEGAAALILERERDARARRANIKACLVSLETAVEPVPFPPLPDERWDMTRPLAGLFERLDHSGLDLIHADGRGILGFDRAESRGVRKALKKDADRVPVTSIQGYLGHAGGTSALFQVVSTALTLNSSKIPPVRNLEHPAKGCDLNYVTGKPLMARVKEVLVLSHGWGGHHSALLMRKE